jgi:hypothetical protein
MRAILLAIAITMPAASEDAIIYEDLVVACPCCPFECINLQAKMAGVITGPGPDACIFIFDIGGYVNVGAIIAARLMGGQVMSSVTSQFNGMVDIDYYDELSDCEDGINAVGTATVSASLGCSRDPDFGLRYTLSIYPENSFEPLAFYRSQELDASSDEIILTLDLGAGPTPITIPIE